MRKRSCVKVGRPVGFQPATAFGALLIVTRQFRDSPRSSLAAANPLTGCEYAKVVGPASGPGIHQPPLLYSILSAPR